MAVGGLFSTAPSHKQSFLEVPVSISFEKTTLNGAEPVILKFSLTNPGTDPVSVLSWDIPGPNGAFADQFIVKFKGYQVEYIGKLAKRRAPIPSDFIEILPGQSLTSEYNLRTAYNISEGGTYAVHFSDKIHAYTGSSNGMSLDKAPGIQGTYVSNVLEISIDKSPRLSREGGLVSRYLRDISGCDENQSNILKSVEPSASLIASKAEEWLINNPEGGDIFETWFGSDNKSRFIKVRKNFVKIAHAFQNKPVRFDCGSCSDKKETYAQVSPNKPYLIEICGAFWKQPDTGENSKAGTLVHEMSHFKVVANTDDDEYGVEKCKVLAAENPRSAIKNADNYEFFSEGFFAVPSP